MAVQKHGAEDIGCAEIMIALAKRGHSRYDFDSTSHFLAVSRKGSFGVYSTSDWSQGQRHLYEFSTSKGWIMAKPPAPR